MNLPPLWKVKRELIRVGVQVGDAVSPINDIPRRWYYDRKIAPRLTTIEGKLSLSKRVAVFVIFQPNGIHESVYFTLEHLRRNGWSPFVVSNAPILPADLERLSECTAAILPRPNLGYDFGAYRSGILALESMPHTTERLIVMNDSTWYPLWESDATLERLEAFDVDMAGHILKIEDENNRARDHVESHLLMFGQAFLQSDDFKQFWHRYAMSNARRVTIERGEKALSQLVIKKHQQDSLLSRESMVHLLERLDDSALRDVAENLIHHRQIAQDEVFDILNKDDPGSNWREKFIEWTYRELSHSLQHLISATFYFPAVKYGGLGFVKKSNELRFHLTRKKLIQMEKDGDCPELHPAVRSEILRSIETWQHPPNWRRSPDQNMREAAAQMEEE